MRLNQVTVPAINVIESIDFYRKLGFRLIVQNDHYARFECPDGEATFSLHLEPEVPRVGQVVIYFEHADLDGLVVSLKAKGLVFESGPVDQSWLWREAHLRDPAGNRICLFRAGDTRRYPPWRLKDPN
ncbi:MAG: VOC family protein [Micropepsaceae bacterium]